MLKSLCGFMFGVSGASLLVFASNGLWLWIFLAFLSMCIYGYLFNKENGSKIDNLLNISVCGVCASAALVNAFTGNIFMSLFLLFFTWANWWCYEQKEQVKHALAHIKK